MSVQEQEHLWGGETAKALENFPISGERVPISVIHWLGRIKGAAAEVNKDLGLLDREIADRIAAAGDKVAEGEYDDQFPLDVFQTGSGTSTNMNANEVIAKLATDSDPTHPVHPNDHVNMGQSSNDVFPTAVHLAALDTATHDLLPALERARVGVRGEGEGIQGRRQGGPDAPDGRGPGDARAGVRRLRRPDATRPAPNHERAPAGRADPARRYGHRHGLNTHPEFAARVRARLTEQTGLAMSPPEDPFEAQGNRDALVELSGALKVVAVSMSKIANDLALMGSGPRAGIGELLLPELQKGSSIMPGKVNPVIPEVVMQVSAHVIGNDAAVTIAGLQGQFELNVRVPLISANLLESIKLLASTARVFKEKCVDGIQANLEGTQRSAEMTLAAATALNPYIGYDKGAEIVKEAAQSGRPLKEVALELGVDEETYDKAMDLRKMAQGNL